jgi:hypothetical protein
VSISSSELFVHRGGGGVGDTKGSGQCALVKGNWVWFGPMTLRVLNIIDQCQSTNFSTFFYFFLCIKSADGRKKFIAKFEISELSGFGHIFIEILKI